MKAAKGFIRRGAFEFIPFPQWLMGKKAAQIKIGGDFRTKRIRISGTPG